MQRGGTQQIAPAHNGVDAHGKIVHGDDELVGEQAVRPADDGIADAVRQIIGLHAEYAVDKGDGVGGGAWAGHGETP